MIMPPCHRKAVPEPHTTKSIADPEMYCWGERTRHLHRMMIVIDLLHHLL
jgi:hypothetical protein